MAARKILVVEDDRTLLDVLKYNLLKEGYEAYTATDGVQALDVARSGKPDLIILDIMLPELNGLEVCRILRKDMVVPVLMLTAKHEEIDKVIGLELGADDYMTKPFSMRELLARVRAMLRRVDLVKQELLSSDSSGSSTLKVGGLEIDLARHQASMNDSVLRLSPKEFELLTFLVKNRGRAFSRDHLLETIWGYDFQGETRTIDTHIRWLRQKTEVNPSNPKHILTVRGVGYKFEV